MSFGLSELDDFAFNYECPAPESIPSEDGFLSFDNLPSDMPLDDSLPSLDYSKALLDGLTAAPPASPEMCVSPSQLRKPSTSRWVPLTQPSPAPRPLCLPSSNQHEPSMWVPISPSTNAPSSVQPSHIQSQYPLMDPYTGEPQQLIDNGPYFASQLSQIPLQNSWLQNSSFASPFGLLPNETNPDSALYQPIFPFSNENAPNAEDFALAPFREHVGDATSSFGASASDPAQPALTRKRRRSVHESDLESSESASKTSLDPSGLQPGSDRRESVFTGRKPRVKTTKLGPPYKHKQTEERRRINENRKAYYYGTKQDPKNSDDEGYFASESTQTRNKAGRPCELEQTEERRLKNEKRRKQYQTVKDDPVVKAKARQNNKSYYDNIRKHTRKQLKLIKEIENTKEFASALGEQSKESDEAVNQDSDEEYVPRRTRSQVRKRVRRE
ncbi:hypothetical protein P7C71_g4032, partial [Lecanoromycetidae sp. Uapishka_2]